MATFQNSGFGNKTEMTEKTYYLGDLRIIGRVVSEATAKGLGEALGYVIMIEKNRKVKMYTEDQTKELLRKFTFVNAKLDGDKIKNTECSMERLPLFDTRMNIIGNRGITILGEIDGQNKYRVMQISGEIVDVTESELLKAIGLFSLINAKVVIRNNKRYISGINQKFTTIQQTPAQQKVSTKVSGKNPWVNKKHVEKLINYTLPHILYSGLTNESHSYIINYKMLVLDTRSRKRIIDIDRETKIIVKEAYSQGNFKLSDADKQMLEKVVKNLKHSEKHIGSYVNIYDKIYMFALAQFALYDANLAVTLMRKLINVDVKSSRLLESLQELGYESEVLKRFLDKLQKKQAKYKEEAEKKALGGIPFNTTDFTTAPGAADIGFAISESNRKFEYISSDGHKRHLKYLGDYIHCDYYKCLEKARCLGDLVAVAAIERILYKYNILDKYNIDSYGVSKGDLRACLEIIIAISYLYSSESVKYCVDSNKEAISRILPVIPDYETISSTDYKLSDTLKLYFESGFNVFYNDYYNHPRYIRKRVYKVAEYTNYRQLPLSYSIEHPLIHNELGAVVNMITSDGLSKEAIDRNIGKLRFL